MASDSRRNRPLTQVEIEMEIADLLETLEGATEIYEQARTAAAKSEVTYRIDFAKEMLLLAASPSKTTVALKDAQATVNTEMQLTQRKMDEATCDAAKAAMETLRDRLSAAQTLLRSVARQT